MVWHEENSFESAHDRNCDSNSQGGAANVHQLAGALASRFEARFVIDLGRSSSRSFLALSTLGFHKVGIRVDSSLGERCERYPSISWVGLGSNRASPDRGFR